MRLFTLENSSEITKSHVKNFPFFQRFQQHFSSNTFPARKFPAWKIFQPGKFAGMSNCIQRPFNDFTMSLLTHCFTAVYLCIRHSVIFTASLCCQMKVESWFSPGGNWSFFATLTTCLSFFTISKCPSIYPLSNVNLTK